MIMNEIDLIKYLEDKDLNKPEDLLVETLEVLARGIHIFMEV